MTIHYIGILNAIIRLGIHPETEKTENNSNFALFSQFILINEC